MGNYEMLDPNEVASYLCSTEKILILFHVRPDPDAVGTAFALRRLMEVMGKKAYCVCSDEVPPRLKFLSQKIQKSVLPSSIPDEFDMAPAVSVDSAAPSQLGDAYEIFKDRIVMMIDHHGRGTQYANAYVVPTASATAEVLATVIDALYTKGVLPWKTGRSYPSDIAELLYAGVAGDTGCFHYSNTTDCTFRLAADLWGSGIDMSEINRKLFEVKTDGQMLAEATGYSRLERYYDGRLALIVFPLSLQKELKLSGNDLETLVDVARCPIGVDVAIVVKESEPGSWRVSSRSCCNVDVASFCALFGGGGHRRAAGGTLKLESEEKVRQTILDMIQSFLQ